MISDKISLLVAKEVQSREDRLRDAVDLDWVSELGDAIASQGLLTPVLVSEHGVIIAGEHRLEAFKRNKRLGIDCNFPSYEGWTKIPARVVQGDTSNVVLLELVENLLRKDMTWKEEAKGLFAVAEELPQGEEEDNTDYAERLSKYTGISPRRISRFLQIQNRMDHPQVAAATNLVEAGNIVSRHKKRELDSIMDSVSDALSAGLDDTTLEVANTEEANQDGATLEGANLVEDGLEEGVLEEANLAKGDRYICLNESFIDWIKDYKGSRFNFLHCDFPYGVNMDKSSMTNADAWSTYADSEDIYFALLDALLEFKEKILSSNSFVLFWYSEKFGDATRRAFYNAGFKRWTHPLIWHKSCNSGILPDYRRGARHTYENAMVFTLGDPFIVSPRADSWSGPATKEHGHVSEKPEDMLQHFFSMFVDEHTRMLDPTAGSHTALKVALAKGAKQVVGIELDEAHHLAGAKMLSKTEVALNEKLGE